MILLRLIPVLLLLLAPAVHADDESGVSGGKDVIPLPRFAALRFSEVNMRTGPGTRYPIAWVYRRANLPVELLTGYDSWYRIRDYAGDEGWVHKTKIRFQRHGLVTKQLHEIRSHPEEQAAIAAHVEPGVIFELRSCATDWCAARGPGYDGYIRKTDFYGAYPQETFN